jgi:hypothetical protein
MIIDHAAVLLLRAAFYLACNAITMHLTCSPSSFWLGFFLFGNDVNLVNPLVGRLPSSALYTFITREREECLIQRDKQN